MGVGGEAAGTWALRVPRQRWGPRRELQRATNTARWGTLTGGRKLGCSVYEGREVQYGGVSKSQHCAAGVGCGRSSKR